MFFLATLFSEDKVASLLGSYLRFTNGLVFFLAWTLLLALFLVIVWEKEKRLFIYKLLFLDALIVAIISLFQSMGIGYYEGLNMPALVRAPGPLGNPNFSAMFMAACLGFAVPLWVSAKKLAAQSYYAVSAIVILWAVVILSSRGAWLGLAASLFCALSLSLITRLPKKNAMLWLVLGAVGVMFWLGFYQLTPRPTTISSAVQLTDANVNSRLSVWKVSGKAIAERPFFGYGPGNFVLAYQAHRSSGEAALGIFDDPHNLFVQLAVEAGIPSVLFFAGLLLLVFWNGLKQSFKEKDTYMISAVSGLVGLLVAACFNPFSVPNYLLLAFFIAVLAVRPKGGFESESQTGVEKPVSRQFQNFSKVLAALFCIIGILFMAGEVWFFQGLKAFNEGNFSKASRCFYWTQIVNPYQELSRIYGAAAGIGLKVPSTEIQKKIETIAQLHPGRSAAYAIESNLYYYWYFYDREESHLNAAISSMEKAVVLDPYFGRRYGRLGYYYLLKNNSDKAVEEMKVELKMEPNYLPGWMLLAKAYQIKGDRSGTVLALKQASALRPDLVDLKNLAKAAEDLDDIRRLIIPGGISPAILE